MHKMVNGVKVYLTEEEIAERLERRRIAEANHLIYVNTVKYKDDRRSEYPSIDELVVALWESVVEGDNTALNDLQEKRVLIKEKYPKPPASE